jgi:hypothetical protein
MKNELDFPIQIGTMNQASEPDPVYLKIQWILLPLLKSGGFLESQPVKSPEHFEPPEWRLPRLYSDGERQG